MGLDPTKVPVGVAPLIPMAERWGIEDDYERHRAVEEASLEDLQRLTRCLDTINEDDLFGWLCGPEAQSSPPTEEYCAFTCLTMAVDLAQVILTRRAGQ